MFQGAHWNEEWDARIRQLAWRLDVSLLGIEVDEERPDNKAVDGKSKTGRKIIPPHTSIVALMEGMAKQLEAVTTIMRPQSNRRLLSEFVSWLDDHGILVEDKYVEGFLKYWRSKIERKHPKT